MTVRVAINGFGRIGRNFARAAWQAGSSVEIVAVNDLVPADVHAPLLARDSTHGPLRMPVRADEQGLVVGDHRVKVLAERDPKALPWAELGIDVVMECSGVFTDGHQASAHVEAGAKRVVISAPATNVDATFVFGVNDDTFDPQTHVVVSNASCTTNCFVPMVKVLDDAFGVRQGLMTTVHAYTNDQNLLDLVHKDPRRARAAAVNVVPTSTGAARATGLVLQAMQGRLDGVSLRVPVPDGSITDLTAVLEAEVGTTEINQAFERAAIDGRLAAVLEYTEEPIVSSDVVGSTASCLFDGSMTMALPSVGGTTLVKAFAWYDNEWGYSNRLVDVARLVSGERR